MNFLSRLLLRLGYVRLQDFGYTLTQDGRIVELHLATNDRLTPVPWQPIALQGATSATSAALPPVPRPLPPPPAQGAAPAHTGAAGPETVPPLADTASGTIVSPAPVRPGATRPRTRSEEEEDEWRVALTRARERAARDAARSQARAARLSAEMRVPPPPDLPPDATQIGIGPARAPATGAPRAEDGSDFAEGSRRHPISRGDSGDVTATDLIRAPGPEDDDTSVDATANRLAHSLQAEPETLDNTIVALAPPPGPPAADKQLPHATARHRRA
jgi:hypothetical protein